MKIDIRFDEEWQQGFMTRLESDGVWSNLQQFRLAYEAEQHQAIPDFNGLLAPKYLPELQPYPHQIEVANTVIEKMNGKAILADEVGLGKTIEAGLILKEYMIRGLVKKALILVPASLVSQWAMELNTKFFIPAAAQRKAYVWEQYDVVVASIDTAKRQPHRDIVMNQNYDLIIIDEAHKLKNPNTKNYEFIKHLKKKFCLLLTATPVQNKLEEIFNLVSLLKPGHLGDISSFEKEYRSNHRSPKNEEKLRELVNKVMVRNRREDTGIEWTKRIVKTIPIDFSPSERAFYDELSALKGIANHFSILTLQRELCSSREAAYMTLSKMAKPTEEKEPSPHILELLQKVATIDHHAKAEKALELIKKIDDKVIIFTEYRATQLYLQWFLQQNGISSVPFRGGFKRGKKDWMRQLFQNNAQVLIATEAGGEGINLQFCSHIINYDLPWNPMRIEQRIGRIHRLGQQKDVHIYNFAVNNTVEQNILSLLYEKIHLFESVIGELDDILTKIELPKIEDYIQEVISESDSQREMEIKFEHLAEIMNQAIEEHTTEGEDLDATASSS
ncbi:ATP-dependent helicase [Alkalihalobacillus alcalophilus ATCC 27647 = CGMCC 1.3604]|uniref:ATP-dependent helicase n=1 Tax=Alkalihalobacillus alcalophilus ATCC 27647 = CGMCC 1.3604 TaxID=1218173 RepID=A0A094WGI7_ALKAL|nr:SNF2-related protein [Alkalihalobacillus alcalophilus]KGA95901.1 ATP-dependent helicase [Alkalihalobacillus alcalophilus ATCC 27647 = CGMCC 1.3604]MED1562886.1 SNF2-related protein [Alkalihalobacillus alcalophilus]THG90659.1 ATP-dependent helicase [Alkalihalobacillus alcalophilus ATCC 27647 = CGMCC 1.3604]